MKKIRLLEKVFAAVLAFVLGIGMLTGSVSAEEETTDSAGAERIESEKTDESSDPEAENTVLKGTEETSTEEMEETEESVTVTESDPDPEPENITYILYAGDYGYYGDLTIREKLVTVPKGSFFKSVEPTPVTNEYIFEGWYTGVGGRGNRVTEETVIDTDGMGFYANWAPNKEVIPVIELDRQYPMDIEVGAVIYSFTPEETAAYNIFTAENDSDYSIPHILLMDDQLRTIDVSDSIDDDYNAGLTIQLTAGVTYYIEFGDLYGRAAYFVSTVTKADVVPVTFHVNTREGEEAYFDGDPSVTEKTIEILKGSHVERYSKTGLKISKDSTISFIGWSLDPEDPYADKEIIVEGPIDVYAIYGRYQMITIDANGGFFSEIHDTKYTVAFYPDTMFTAYYDPVSSDENLEFAGWAASPDAQEPEFQIGNTYQELPDTLYAIYTEIVKVTFDANGGYLHFNPELKTLTETYGKGHIYYTIHVEHENSNMLFLGWEDQDGVMIPNTTKDVPEYQYMKDTYLTAVWGKYVVIDGNGAFFMFDPSVTALKLLFPVNKPFDNNYVIEAGLAPYNPDSSQAWLGWATSPDAEEPDVIDGETDITDLTWIYAVWKDDSYYIEEGADQKWVKGSTEGLTVVVKRTYDDTMTYPCFDSVTVDGEQVIYPAFRSKEGSLILTFQPDYLDSLKTGKHDVSIRFTGDVSVNTTFTVTEKDDSSDEDQDKPVKPDKKSDSSSQNQGNAAAGRIYQVLPDTSDHSNLQLWTVILILSVIAAAVSAFVVFGKKRT